MELVQIERGNALTPRARGADRKPPWLKVRAPGGSNYADIRRMMRDLRLNTVCEEARCPNIGECWEHRAATFMVLGDVCTRNCAYCAVAHGTPAEYDPAEPARLAHAVEHMGLQHVVVTSVDRDDLPNGGAEIFAGCVTEIHARLPDTTVEVLIPDFKGSEGALRIVVDAEPDILNHNLETVQRLYRMARPGGDYQRALDLLRRAKNMNPDLVTKSGIMQQPPSGGAVLHARRVQRAARRGTPHGIPPCRSGSAGALFLPRVGAGTAGDSGISPARTDR
jgi:lipoic acid synthetase